MKKISRLRSQNWLLTCDEKDIKIKLTLKSFAIDLPMLPYPKIPIVSWFTHLGRVFSSSLGKNCRARHSCIVLKSRSDANKKNISIKPRKSLL